MASIDRNCEEIVNIQGQGDESLEKHYAGPEPSQDCCTREFGSIRDNQWHGMSLSLHRRGVDMFAETLPCPLRPTPGKDFRSRDSPELLATPVRNHEIMGVRCSPSSSFGGGSPWCL